MAFLRCLQSDLTVNYNTGADFGETTTSTFFLPNTPIDYNTVTGYIYAGAINVQTFVVLSGGALQLTDIGSPSTKVLSGTLNIQTGKLVLTWNSAPGTNYVVASYTGGPIYKDVTSQLFYATCPSVNLNCSTTTSAYVAAVTVCNQNLYV